MKKRLWKGKILFLSVALLFISCMSASVETQAASKLGQVKKVTVKAAGCTSVKISWRKVKGAKGYRIYRAKSKNGKYKRIKTTKSTSYTNTKLTSGKRYYYKVHAFSGSKTGKYSAVKSGVTKSHSWKKVAAAGHYETRYVQVPFSQASAPWDQIHDDYVCLCNTCQTINIRYNSEADLMRHMNEVNSPGWVEEIYEDRTFCNNCGKDITGSGPDVVNHTMNCGAKGHTSKLTLMYTIEHRATVQKVWVQDTKAYTYCTRCKTRK